MNCCLDHDNPSSHTRVIRAHYVFLLETLDVKFSGLVSELHCRQVVSAVEAQEISAEQTSFTANEKLLAVLSRKSPQQFSLFLEALDNNGQQHVRDIIDDRRGFLAHTNNMLKCVTWLRKVVYGVVCVYSVVSSCPRRKV